MLDKRERELMKSMTKEQTSSSGSERNESEGVDRDHQVKLREGSMTRYQLAFGESNLGRSRGEERA